MSARYVTRAERIMNGAFSGHSASLGYDSTPVRVLIVEDEPALSDQLSRALVVAGYAVDTAADGDRADFAVRTESYDAVLLDLGLPRIDGLTLLRGWRAS